MSSLARFNLSKDAEDAINKQIQAELQAHYTYLSMSTYFNRDSVSLPGFSKYFKAQSQGEYEHAQALIAYLSKRGGTVQLETINAPTVEWPSALAALEASLELEKSVYGSLLAISKIASDNSDPELDDFISSEFLHEQVADIKIIADMITQLYRAGDSGLGLYLYDRTLL